MDNTINSKKENENRRVIILKYMTRKTWNILFFVLFTLLFLFLAQKILRNYLYDSKYCKPPVKYSIGTIDPRFNLDRDKIVSIAKKAGKNWDDTTGREQYIYEETGSTKINFVYDDRQETRDANRQKLSVLGFKFMSEEKLIDELMLLSKETSPEKKKIYSEAINLVGFSEKDGLGANKYINQSSSVITVYAYDGDKDLEVLLMHELGHSKTRVHAKEKTSIMYPEGPEILTTIPTNEDRLMIRYCK
ncbi:MAG: matrixin family metalloprotease [bacterium]